MAQPAGSRVPAAFLMLVAAQAAHSIEEYLFRLYDVFAPARMVSGLVSTNLARGFLVVNAAIVVFGVWCYAALIGRGQGVAGPGMARTVAWGWAAVEWVNGVGHLSMASARGDYFPGTLTAPVLVAAAAHLVWRLRRVDGRPSIE